MQNVMFSLFKKSEKTLVNSRMATVGCSNAKFDFLTSPLKPGSTTSQAQKD
jgi:hypothetical protein